MAVAGSSAELNCAMLVLLELADRIGPRTRGDEHEAPCVGRREAQKTQKSMKDMESMKGMEDSTIILMLRRCRSARCFGIIA